jgi:hypothetical protein
MGASGAPILSLFGSRFEQFRCAQMTRCDSELSCFAKKMHSSNFLEASLAGNEASIFANGWKLVDPLSLAFILPTKD